MSNNEMIHVGVDDGHNNTCIYTTVNNEPVKVAISSRAINGKVNKIMIGKNEKKVFEITTDNNIYTVGSIDHSLHTTFNEYPVSEMNRVIVNYALCQAGLSGRTLDIVTGLPMKHFYKMKGENVELIDAKIKNLISANHKTVSKDLNLPNIIKHSVLPEGVAAWMDLFLTMDKNTGEIIRNDDLRKERIAIVDIGGRTTDIAVVKDFQADYGRSATIDRGMLDVYDYIGESIYDNFGAEEIDDEEIHRSIETKKIKIFGEDQDIEEIVEEAKDRALGKIHNEVIKKLGNASDIQKVYFVGGGSLVFKDIVQRWYPKNGKMADDPLFANARGMYKFAIAIV